MSRHQLVEHHPQGPHVGAGVGVLGVAELLGGHVGRGAHRDVAAGGVLPEHGGLANLGQPEVGHLRREAVFIGRQQHVAGLEVPVDETLAMGVGHSPHHPTKHVEALRQGR